MTLPGSGPISINDIAAEFGMPNNSPFPSAFYGKGGAPGSGPLSFADFYGRSNNKIAATKTSVRALGFGASDVSTITVTGGTISTITLISGTESARVLKSGYGAASGTISISNPTSGNGIVGINTYRVTASNGLYIDIDVYAEWGNV